MKNRPTLISSELVSVQPLSPPTNKIYYVDFIYKTSAEQTREMRRKKIERIFKDDNTEPHTEESIER